MIKHASFSKEKITNSGSINLKYNTLVAALSGAVISLILLTKILLKSKQSVIPKAQIDK